MSRQCSPCDAFHRVGPIQSTLCPMIRQPVRSSRSAVSVSMYWFGTPAVRNSKLPLVTRFCSCARDSRVDPQGKVAISATVSDQ